LKTSKAWVATWIVFSLLGLKFQPVGCGTQESSMNVESANSENRPFIDIIIRAIKRSAVMKNPSAWFDLFYRARVSARVSPRKMTVFPFRS
jgi:hypothetical protein